MALQPVCRLGDNCSGHGCYPPRPNSQASPNVFANGIAVHRDTDNWNSHCCGVPCHGGNTISMSNEVYVNGLLIARITDPVDCGSTIAEGSPNVYSG